MRFVLIRILILSLVIFVSNMEDALSVKGKYGRNTKYYQIVYPIKVANNVSERYLPKRQRPQNISISAVQYIVNLQGIAELIDLEPNSNLLAADAVLELRNNLTSDVDPLININLRRLSIKDCYYNGKVRNYEDSSVALSTCDGLCGFIRVKRRTYLIEPVAGTMNVSTQERRPHIIYENNDSIESVNCATEPKLNDDNSHSSDTKQEIIKNKPFENGGNWKNLTKSLVIETLLVLDKSMIDLHYKKDIENYVLTIFNMAQTLFSDLSMDPLINLELVRIIEVEDENDNINSRRQRHLGRAILEEFSDWQARTNPKEESHPNHHDLAILLTGKRLCDENERCHYVGIAESQGICNEKKQAAVCTDSGLILGYVIAHQVAHTLGVKHDTERNGERKQLTDQGLFNIMSPVITSRSRHWSNSSRSSLISTMENWHLKCLEDKSIKKFRRTDILPGVLYDADYQCQKLFSSEARSCNQPGECESLACELNGTACFKTGLMSAPGTSCGENQWCYDGECLEPGKRPQAEDGSWGSWSNWSECSRTCGSGVSKSSRECDSPAPKHGGKLCVGRRIRHKICTTQPCPVGSQSFRDVQCAKYNDWIFPEDGAKHKWKGFFNSSGSPCALYCKNEDNITAPISTKVKDGTTCYRGIRDICIDGICREMPCDLQFDSSSLEDGCGLCHGNGTGCEVHHGLKEVNEGTNKIITIPTGTRNIIVEQTTQIPSHFLLKNHSYNNTINEGKRLGMYYLNGGIAWLGMIRKNQEILEIPGPLMEPIEVWISSERPQKVSYSMGLPTDPREGKYTWDYIDWSPCKAQCGESIQESVPKCAEQLSGRVEDKYCEQSEKPPIKTRNCNAGICSTRWFIGEWQGCGPCPYKGAKRFRRVQCVKPIASTENGMTIVDDNLCPGNRPTASEHCRCVKRQIIYPTPHYKANLFPADFRSLIEKSFYKGTRVTNSPEKKVTLMQLENENEESMQKQFKENQLKHHSSFYMPSGIFNSRFNFSIPFKKRETEDGAISNQLNQEIKSIRHFPTHFPIRWVNIHKKNNIPFMLSTRNLHQLDSNNGQIYEDDIMEISEPTDYPPFHFSEKNILRLLSENLPLERLKQQQELRRKNEKQKILPNMVLINEGSNKQNQNHKIGILDIIMNEFYNILSANAFVKPKITKTSKDIYNLPKSLENSDNYLKSKIKIENLRSGVDRKEIPESIEIFLNPNDEQIIPVNDVKHYYDEIVRILNKMNETNSDYVDKNDDGSNSNFKYKNNERVDPLYFRNEIKKQILADFLKKHNLIETENKFKTIKNNDSLIQNSSPHSLNNATSKNCDKFESIAMRANEKFKLLSIEDKLRAFVILTGVVNNLKDLLLNTLYEVNGVENNITGHDIISLEQDEVSNTSNIEERIISSSHFYPLRDVNNNPLEYNQTKWYSLDNTILPIAEDEASKITKKYPLEYLVRIYQALTANQSSDGMKLINNGITKNQENHAIKRKSIYNNTNQSRRCNYSDIKRISVLTLLNDSTANVINNLRHRREKLCLEKLSNNKTNINQRNKKTKRGKRCAEQGIGRKITGIYSLPEDRICPTLKSSRCNFKQHLQHCAKEIMNFPPKKNYDLQMVNAEEGSNELGNSFEREVVYHPKNIEITEMMGRIKRYPSNCSSIDVCKEICKIFKNEIANAHCLNSTMCEKLNSDIAEARRILTLQKHMMKELQEIKQNCASQCYYLYKFGTTPSPPIKEK